MRLSYSERGNIGTLPLILIHAFPLDRHMWRYQLDDLSDLCRIITPDTPGFGDSPLLDAEPSMQAYVHYFLDILDNREIERAIWGGCSIGGYLLFELWRQAPKRVAGFILCDTRAEADSDEARQKRMDTIAQVEKEGVSPLAESMLEKLLGEHTLETRQDLVQEVKNTILSNHPHGVIHSLQAMASRPDSTETLKTITAPTLILVGEQDQLTPPELAQKIHSGIPNSTLEVIPKAGHLSPYEQPEIANRAIRKFLEGIV